MLRRLSEYKLGIFMPHTHDWKSGEFQPLPDGVMQVESGLKVSFHPRKEISTQPDRFMPVGWIWHAGAAVPAAACEMESDDESDVVKHKMVDGN